MNSKPLVLISCLSCLKQFKIKPCEVGRRFYCSKKCYTEHQSSRLKGRFLKEVTKKICLVCKKDFLVSPSRKSKQFCSYECYWKNKQTSVSGENNHRWRGGHGKYRGPNWEEQRRLTLARDTFLCCKCGLSTNHVHHIIRFKDCSDYLAANNLSNLLTLCSKCHKAKKGIETLYQEWFRSKLSKEEIKERTLLWTQEKN